MCAKKPEPRSGYVALIGRTNAGKSTFLNTIMETKVAIVSDKPQTTRKRILGIKTSARGQIIFFDSPGVHKPHYQLNQRMMKEVHDAMAEADLILYFVTMQDDRTDPFLLELLEKAGKPVFLVLNKIDLLNKGKILERISFFKDQYPWQEIVPISALTGLNLDRLEDLIYPRLPEGDPLFAADEWTRQSERFYVSELIREKLLRLIRDELPYITAVQVEEMEDRERVVYVRADIFVESQSQKKILVGKKGAMIREIGGTARQELEDYFSKQVFIELFVKVMPNWRNSPHLIKDIFG